MNELYELPNGWEWKPLKDICKFENGDRGKNYPSKSAFVETGIAVISATNLNGWGIDLSGLNYITEDKYNSIGGGKVKNGDILFCLRGSLGKSGLVENFDKGVIASSLVIVRATEDLSTKLLLYYFNSNLVNGFINQYNNGAAQPNLSGKNLSLFDFPLPPLSEQQRIVSKLNSLFQKIDKSIELHQKNMDEANAFMGSVLNEVFVELEEKYSKKHLKDIVSKLGDGLHGTPKYDEAGEYYFINGANVSDNKIIVNQNTKKVNEEEYHKYKKELNDKTIFVSINGTLGNIGLYDNEKCILGKSACYFNLLDNIDKIYITYVLKNQDFQQYIRENATGATIKNVSLKTMREYNVVLPPLSIQQKVVEYLDEISEKMEKVKTIQKEKMESLKALKASILDKAFRGEL